MRVARPSQAAGANVNDFVPSSTTTVEPMLKRPISAPWATAYERGASLATLRQRAAMLAAIRSFFAARGVLEVETPALSSAGVTDPAIESVIAETRSLAPARQYLQTSPEFAMKRLLAAGSGDIYQLCRVFRDDELGRWHQPEFTMLEWYRVGWDELALMTEVAELVATACVAAGHAPAPTVRVSYAQALQAALGAFPRA